MSDFLPFVKETNSIFTFNTFAFNFRIQRAIRFRHFSNTWKTLATLIINVKLKLTSLVSRKTSWIRHSFSTGNLSLQSIRGKQKVSITLSTFYGWASGTALCTSFTSRNILAWAYVIEITYVSTTRCYWWTQLFQIFIVEYLFKVSRHMWNRVVDTCEYPSLKSVVQRTMLCLFN